METIQNQNRGKRYQSRIHIFIVIVSEKVNEIGNNAISRTKGDSAKEKRIILGNAKEVLNGVVKFEEGCQGVITN